VSLPFFSCAFHVHLLHQRLTWMGLVSCSCSNILVYDKLMGKVPWSRCAERMHITVVHCFWRYETDHHTGRWCHLCYCSISVDFPLFCLVPGMFAQCTHCLDTQTPSSHCMLANPAADNSIFEVCSVS
jgi:hypothetical protein